MNLSELVIRLDLTNTDNKRKVKYVINTTTTYQKTNKAGKVITKPKADTSEGTIDNPAIDLTKAPQFSLVTDLANTGVFVFKNSFPYSKKD